jgi:hypothetical protein
MRARTAATRDFRDDARFVPFSPRGPVEPLADRARNFLIFFEKVFHRNTGT